MRLHIRTCLVLILFIILSLTLNINTYSQDNVNINELSEEDELKLLIENYEDLLKTNAGWNDKNKVVKEIKKFIDSNYHNAKAYDIIVKWYYNDRLLSRVKQYGQKAIDVSNKLGKVFFTRDILYYMGKYYTESDALDYAYALGYFNIVNGMGKDDYPAKADLFYNIGICYKQLHSARGSVTNNKYAYLSEAAFEFAIFLEKDIEYHYQLGQVYEYLNKYKKALNIYDKALKINPSFTKVINAKNKLKEKISN